MKIHLQITNSANRNNGNPQRHTNIVG